MKPARFKYRPAHDLGEALRLLEEGGVDARPLAGGQSLVPAMNLRLARPALLVDLNRIPGLRGLRVGDDGSVIAGALTRHSDFEFSELVAERLPMLRAAMAGVAHPAIRNRGTIGGSLAHADPAGDWPALCLACDAQLVLSSRGGGRVVPAEEFSQGFFSTALSDAELITEIRFPAWPKTRHWGHQKMTRRRGDFAIAGVIAVIDLGDGGQVSRARIVVFGATDAPLVAHEAGALAVGLPPAAIDANAIGKAAAAVAPFHSNLHASATYKQELVQTLACRAIAQALAGSNMA